MKDVRDIAAFLLLVLIAAMLGRALYGAYESYERGPTITVESVEFNESCRPTHLFVVDMKGHALRVFDCGD